MAQKPTSVLVIAIIGICLAGLGLLGMIFIILIRFAGITPRSPLLASVEQEPFYIGVTMTSYILGAALTFLLLVASIGSLRLKTWARKGMIFYAWLALAHLALGLLFDVAYLFPKMFAAAGPSPSSDLRAGLIGGVIGGCGGSLLGLIFPCCILYFFTRQKVIDAFNGIFPAETGNFEIILPSDSHP